MDQEFEDDVVEIDATILRRSVSFLFFLGSGRCMGWGVSASFCFLGSGRCIQSRSLLRNPPVCNQSLNFFKIFWFGQTPDFEISCAHIERKARRNNALRNFKFQLESENVD